MFCTKCGNTIADKAKFCDKCGALISSDQQQNKTNISVENTGSFNKPSERKNENDGMKSSQQIPADNIDTDRIVLTRKLLMEIVMGALVVFTGCSGFSNIFREEGYYSDSVSSLLRMGFDNIKSMSPSSMAVFLFFLISWLTATDQIINYIDLWLLYVFFITYKLL